MTKVVLEPAEERVGVNHLAVESESFTEAKRVLLTLFTDVVVSVNVIRHVPCHRQVIRSFTGRMNDPFTVIHIFFFFRHQSAS